MVRRGGFRWPLLYNVIDGEWEVIMMDARIGMKAGGVLSGMSLLEKEVPQLNNNGGGTEAHAGHPHIAKR